MQSSGFRKPTYSQAAYLMIVKVAYLIIVEVGGGCSLGRRRGALKMEPLLNPLLALLNRDLIQRVYIPKGPPNPIP